MLKHFFVKPGARSLDTIIDTMLNAVLFLYVIL